MFFRSLLASIRQRPIHRVPRRKLTLTLPLYDHLDVRRIDNKNHVGSENVFSRNVFLSNPSKYKSLAPVWRDNWSDELLAPRTNSAQTPWASLTTKELLSTFRTISESVHQTEERLSDPKYNDMCRVMSERFHEMSDDELRFVLETMAFWGLENTITAPNFHALWKSLDSACQDRWRNWPVDKILLFADYWYNLYLARQSNFVYRAITKVAMRPKRLTPHQLVQLLFFLNVLRTLNERIDMYEIEFQLKNCVNELSLDEIGVAATGFFKTQNVLHDKQLMIDIIDRVINEKDSVEEITLTCILKVLRLSLMIQLAPKLMELMDSLESLLVEKLSLQATSHVALLLTKFPVFHEKVLNNSAQFLLDNLKNARIKDMEKIVYSSFLLSYDPPTTANLFEAVGREILERRDSEELAKYSMSLVALLNYLSSRQVFIEPLISHVLDETFFRRVYGKTNYSIRREILSLDTNVEIDCPGYSGVRLSPQMRKYMSMRYYLYPPELDKPPKHHNLFFFDILKLIDSSLGQDKYVVKHILPHSPRPDIVIQLDNSGSPVSIPEEFRLISDFEGPIRPPSSSRWISLVVASRNMFAYDGVCLLGETSAKMRQLRSLGFEPKLVSFFDYSREEDEKMKWQYLKNLILSENRPVSTHK